MSQQASDTASRRALLAGLVVVGAAACSSSRPQPVALTPNDIQARFFKSGLPRTEPLAAAWNKAPEHAAQLLLQDQTAPKLLTKTVNDLRVRALHDDAWIVFRLQWDHAPADPDAPVSRFPDAAALQVPLLSGGDVPDGAMGQVGRPVRIHMWKSDWQVRSEGKETDIIAARYPNAGPRHYPWEHADPKVIDEMQLRYCPAKAVGNPMALGPVDSPVQDLLAEGFGTLTPAREQVGVGRGVLNKNTWSVTIARPLDSQPGQCLRPGERTYAAFALWQGSASNTGARKMRTAWIALQLEPLVVA